MTFGILGNIGKPALKEVLHNLLAFLRKESIPFVVLDDLATWAADHGESSAIDTASVCTADDLPRRSDVILAFGGDGTILTAARLVGRHGIPILGVNLGKLGFLAEVSVGDVNAAVEDVVAGRYVVDERMTLSVSSSAFRNDLYALNEFVVDKGSSARVIALETFVNNDYLVTYTADGMIVTTPTGSTAYSLASGGPIVTPKSSVLTINPISPHTLTARAVVVPDDSHIRIAVKAASKGVHYTADGQEEGIVEAPVEFTVRKSPHPIRLIKRGKHTYYDLLRAKLMWGRDVRLGIKL
jgi:NAD+ kinase